MTVTLSHGGDLGDAVLALPTVRRLSNYDATGGRAHLVFHPAPGKVREPWTKKKVDQARDFFELQPYIASVQYSHRPAGINLDQWRARYNSKLNLADMVSAAFNVPAWDHATPWAIVDNPNPVAAVVIHRSPRYHGPFCWHDVVNCYRDAAVFVGSPDEHSAFTTEFGYVPFHFTPTVLALARVIAGCGLFVGNQSMPLTVAEALKVPVWVEECVRTPNARFIRSGTSYGPGRIVIT